MLLLIFQFLDKRLQKGFDMLTGLQSEFLAQFTSFVIDTVGILVFIDHPDSVLGKSEA